MKCPMPFEILAYLRAIKSSHFTIKWNGFWNSTLNSFWWLSNNKKIWFADFYPTKSFIVEMAFYISCTNFLSYSFSSYLEFFIWNRLWNRKWFSLGKWSSLSQHLITIKVLNASKSILRTKLQVGFNQKQFHFARGFWVLLLTTIWKWFKVL